MEYFVSAVAVVVFFAFIAKKVRDSRKAKAERAANPVPSTPRPRYDEDKDLR